jgi:hypothetical protein
MAVAMPLIRARVPGVVPTRSGPASSPRPSQSCSGSARAPCPGPAAARFSRAGSRRRWPPAETRSSQAGIPSRDRLEHRLGAVDLATAPMSSAWLVRDHRGSAPSASKRGGRPRSVPPRPEDVAGVLARFLQGVRYGLSSNWSAARGLNRTPIGSDLADAQPAPALGIQDDGRRLVAR